MEWYHHSTMKIGKKIRELRLKKEWTLADLARESGMALSSLSRIETGKMTGTIESHILVAKSLGVRLPELYAEVDPASATIEYRSQSQNSDKFAAKGTLLTVLTSGTLRKKMLPVLVSMQAGKSSQQEQAPEGVEKFLYLVKGQIEVTAGEKKISMNSGDSLYIQVSVPHSFKNNSSSVSLLLVVTCPPNF